MAKGGISTRGEYTVHYSNMRGVDFSCTEEDSGRRFLYLENMYRDYERGGELIESVPGYRKIFSAGRKINAIHPMKSRSGDTVLIVHSAESLYRLVLNGDGELVSSATVGTVKNTRSRAFSIGYELFVIDGEKIVKIGEDGAAITIGDEGAEAYVPTTYINGVEHEQRNLLTDEFIEMTTVSSRELYNFGSHKLCYRVLNDEQKTCSVAGLDSSFSYGNVIIPSYARIGGELYRVTEIDDEAFSLNTKMADVIINEGVVRIGKNAFSGCTGIALFYCPHTLEQIDDEAFLNCTSLMNVYVGRGLKSLGKDVFSGCTRINSVSFLCNPEPILENLVGIEELDGIHVSGYASYRNATIEIMLNTPTSSVTEVTVDGVKHDYLPITENGRIVSVLISEDDGRMLEGRKISVRGVADESGLFDGFTGSGRDAIFGCTICEGFDGRIFLSGNPNLPNTVLFSSRVENGTANPYYFGVYDYFNDGIGAYPVVTMLAASDSLAVFKADDDGCGSIFYHLPSDTGKDVVPKVYPVSYVHSGICAVGDSISFYDDPVFISRSGLSALDKQAISLERSVATRSHNVNPRLLAESGSLVRLCKWCGYLVVACDGKIFLADSRATFRHRSGETEYEWFFLSGVGCYDRARPQYRYAHAAPEGFATHGDVDGKVTGEVMSVYTEVGELVYYVEEGGVKYAVYPTEEYKGGIFFPLCTVCSVDERLLFFGTTGGQVCVFNNDKRGVPPPALSAAKDFSKDSYLESYGREIDPVFYAFDDRAAHYELRTAFDGVGLPNMTKSTVKHSMTVKCRVRGTGQLNCHVGTNGGSFTEAAKIPSATLDFSAMNFSALSFDTAGSFTLPISEKEKGWIEKQISITGDEYQSPIGIYSMTYRFTPKGRIKKG